MKLKETDLAKILIESFIGTEYEIYQEVETYIGIADVVLKHANFTWAVEVKTSLSLQVIAQAWMNCRKYNFSSICVPKGRHSKSSQFALDICRRYGIGVFKIKNNDSLEKVTEVLKAKFRRNVGEPVRLVDQQKTFAAAGNGDGSRWTPFNQTVSELKMYISKKPGCKLKDALNNIGHHYASLSSAQNSIRKWIRSGVIQGIVIDRGICNLEKTG